MKNAMFKFSAALTLAAAATSAAYAGGFMLTEQSVAGLGRAYAGSGIVGDDLSAVWYNPAGMVLLPSTGCCRITRPQSGTTRPVWCFCPARSFRWVP